jgi:DNA primase catalytic core, N-terminal domain
MQGSGVAEVRLEELLADAAGFFEAYLWESESCEVARTALAEQGLDEQVIRSFGVGYAPVGPDTLMSHLRGLGYSDEELVAAGLATRSVRGKAHAQFRSRIMFPVRDEEGRVRGFAALGTHLGPSWPQWVTSPDDGYYRRSDAVFGLDRAATGIAASGMASLRRDCIEVLRAHQDGQTNAVTVHSSTVTRDQMLALANGVPGGIDALEVELPPGMRAEPKGEPDPLDVAREGAQGRSGTRSGSAVLRPRHLNLKKVVLVTATALVAINAWTGAPLLAVWIGSHAQSGKVLSMWGVLTVLAVLGVLEFMFGWALTWLSARYDRLTGRPRLAGQTSPWHRAKRGDRVQDVRSRYGISAPEAVVAASVIAGVLALEIWFFFFAGSMLV